MTLLQDLPAKERMDSCFFTVMCCISILRSFPQTAVKILHLSTEKFLVSPPEQLVLFSASGKILDKTHDTQGEPIQEAALIHSSRSFNWLIFGEGSVMQNSFRWKRKEGGEGKGRTFLLSLDHRKISDRML